MTAEPTTPNATWRQLTDAAKDALAGDLLVGLCWSGQVELHTADGARVVVPESWLEPLPPPLPVEPTESGYYRLGHGRATYRDSSAAGEQAWRWGNDWHTWDYLIETLYLDDPDNKVRKLIDPGEAAS